MAGFARASSALVVASALVLGAAGCGSLSAGDDLARDYATWMKGAANVRTVDTRGRNLLLTAGDAEADVVLTPGVTVAEADAVMRHATAFPFRPSHPLTISIVYDTAGFTASFEVHRNADARNLEMMQLAVEVDTQTSASVLSASHDTDDDVLSVTDDGDLLTAFDRLHGLLVTHDLLTFDVYCAQSTNEKFSITSSRSDGDPRVRAAYEAVKARYPVTDAQLSDDGLDLRIGAPETPDVAELVRRVTPGVPATIQFGNVTKTGEGDYTAADAVIGAANQTGAVTRVDAYPTWITVHCVDVAAMFTVDHALADSPEAGDVRVGYSTDDDKFTIRASRSDPPTDPRTYEAVLTQLSRAPWSGLIEGVSIDDDGIEVVALDDATSGASAIGAALSATVPSGTHVEVVFPNGGTVRFVGSAHLRRADLDQTGDPHHRAAALIDAFLGGWNSPLPGSRVGAAPHVVRDTGLADAGKVTPRGR